MYCTRRPNLVNYKQVNLVVSLRSGYLGVIGVAPG